MARVVLGLGSNKDFGVMSSKDILQGAIKALCAFIGQVVYSSVYETQPMYFTNQKSFLNMVVAGEYKSTPRDLLNAIHKIESDFGRDRTKEIKNGPRTLDIDIEIFDSVVINSPDLVIPHPRLQERAFVLVPLVEVLHKAPFLFDVPFYEAMLNALGQKSLDVVKIQ